MAEKKSIWRLAIKAAGVEGKLAKISGLADKTADRFTKAQNRISGFANGIKKNIRSAAQEIPLLGRAFDLATNPVVLGTAVIAGAIALLGSATLEAKKFNHEFLQIRQLNLDKNVAQMDAYKEKIRDTSFQLGTNLMDSTKAFYDLQSGTGLYGDAAVAVFEKVGRYSIATGANVIDSMNSTVKAVRAFGLEIDQIDNLLLSNAKTVQMGITTFEELAKVQTEYAGAAASANQTVDTANKLFAAFTSIAKNSDIGANMTKTAFQGLKEQAENIKKYTNISVFDNGKMRQADDILIDIARKFKTLNQEQISHIITKIGGPEGLRELLGKVQTGADDLIKTFEGFDSSQFNLEDALKNAKGDVTVLSDIVKNRYQTVMSKLGEKTLPLVATVLDKINGILEWAYSHWDELGTAVKVTATIIGAYTVAQWAMNIAMAANPVGIVVIALALYVGWLIYAAKVTNGFAETLSGVTTIATEFWNQIKLTIGLVASEVMFKTSLMKLEFVALGQHIAGVVSNVKLAFEKLKSFDFAGAKDALTQPIVTKASVDIENLQKNRNSTRDEYVNNMGESARRSLDGLAKINRDQIRLMGIFTGKGPKLDVQGMTEDMLGIKEGGTGTGFDFGGSDDSGNEGNDPLKDGLKSITGGGKSVRSVTVTIGKLIEQMTIQSGSVREGAEETREIVQEELVKAVQGFEIAVG